MPQEALRRTLRQSNFFVGITGYAQKCGVPLSKQIREWVFHAPLGTWLVKLYALKEGEVRD
jgi:hypothetical protein